jgi:hypothetical protein
LSPYKITDEDTSVIVWYFCQKMHRMDGIMVKQHIKLNIRTFYTIIGLPVLFKNVNVMKDKTEKEKLFLIVGNQVNLLYNFESFQSSVLFYKGYYW